MPRALGLDVGGANLKAAHSGGQAVSRPFALWKDPSGLPDALRDLLRGLPPANGLAVTMTGELCDCFAGKAEGVCAILDGVEAVTEGRPVRVFGTDGRFRSPSEARAEPLRAAAANWLALSTFAGRFAPRGPALLLDVGSTTTDVVPLLDGRPVPAGRLDPERLASGELVYTGVRRTPLCAVLGPDVAAELFATTLDAWLVVGGLEPDEADGNTADGRPATPRHAHARLARMLCADLETSTEAQRLALAEEAVREQSRRIAQGLGRVVGRLPGPPRTVVLAGEGAFLAERVVREAPWARECRVVRLREMLGAAVSQAACAYAVAVLVGELAYQALEK